MAGKESMAQALIRVDIDLLDTAPERRTYSNPKKYRRLVHSISETGLVRPLAVYPPERGRYTLRSGNRRLRACRDAGLSEVLCLVDDRPENPAEDVLEWIADNDQVEMLDPISRALAWEEARTRNEWSQTQLANHLDLNQGHISHMLALIEDDVSPLLQDKVRSGAISFRLATKILAIKDPEARNAAIEAGKITKPKTKIAAPEESPPEEEEKKPEKQVHKDVFIVPKKGKLGGTTWHFVGRKKAHTPNEIIEELLFLVEHLRSLNKLKIADLGEEESSRPAEHDGGAETIPFAQTA